MRVLPLVEVAVGVGLFVVGYYYTVQILQDAFEADQLRLLLVGFVLGLGVLFIVDGLLDRYVGRIRGKLLR